MSNDGDRRIQNMNDDDEGSLEGEFRVKDETDDGSISPRENPNVSIDSGCSDTSIDKFVNKLERLMEHRARQYQERVTMDKERERRKKQREHERKQRLKKTQTNNGHDDNEQQGKMNTDTGTTMDNEEFDVDKNSASSTVDDVQHKKEDGDIVDNINTSKKHLSHEVKLSMNADDIAEMTDKSTYSDASEEDKNKAEVTSEEEQQPSPQQESVMSTHEITTIATSAIIAVAEKESEQLFTQDVTMTGNTGSDESDIITYPTQKLSPPEEAWEQKESLTQEHAPQRKQAPSPSPSIDDVLATRSSSFEENPDVGLLDQEND
mmetsp:Transcript_35763/g.48029  ORF Transcript_35763/g.48029 Transcript_35763/m.48029 type:complete len:320 (+) Transcript_35763:1-960(+)